MSLQRRGERITADDVEGWLFAALITRFTQLNEFPLRDTLKPLCASIVEAFELQENDGNASIVTHVHKDENRCTSSIAIGTESRGGQTKVYFDPDNPEGMLDRIDVALVGRAYASNIVAAANKGGEHNPFGEVSALGKKFKKIVREHERLTGIK